jgi:hypothetical protein
VFHYAEEEHAVEEDSEVYSGSEEPLFSNGGTPVVCFLKCVLKFLGWTPDFVFRLFDDLELTS